MTRHAEPGRALAARSRTDALASDLPEPREPAASWTEAPQAFDAGASETRLDDAPRPLSRRERAAVIDRIEALMEFWGITLDDLEGPDPAPPPAAPAAIKYRHPVTGDTWDGTGPHPDWLRRALLQEGLRVDELKPDADLAPPPSPSA